MPKMLTTRPIYAPTPFYDRVVLIYSPRVSSSHFANLRCVLLALTRLVIRMCSGFHSFNHPSPLVYRWKMLCC